MLGNNEYECVSEVLFSFVHKRRDGSGRDPPISIVFEAEKILLGFFFVAVKWVSVLTLFGCWEFYASCVYMYTNHFLPFCLRCFCVCFAV